MSLSSTQTVSIILSSIGDATPKNCQSIAETLGVNSDKFLRDVFQAPKIFLDNVPSADAQKTVEFLQAAGLEVNLSDEAIDETCALFDVAIFLRDISKFREVAGLVASFVGSSKETAAEMLATPPGLILGEVSAATVARLRARLASLDVDVQSASKSTATYMLSADFDDPGILKQIAEVLGQDVPARKLFRDVGFEPAQKIWHQFGRTEKLRLVNQAFERWEISLLSCRRVNNPAAELARITDIPAEICAQIPDHVPLAIDESVSGEDVDIRMQRFTDLGFDVRADLSTFRNFHLRIDSVCDLSATRSALDEVGLSMLARDLKTSGLQIDVPFPLPDVKARYLRHLLGEAGCETSLEISA